MKRTGIIIAVVVATVAVVVAMAMSKNQNNDRQAASPESGAQSETAPNNREEDKKEASQAEPANTNEVEIEDFAFAPAKITVKKGTTVTWTNKDGARHDVTPDQPSDNFKASELLAKGESYSFTFNEEGTYTYHCSPHPYMKGTVEVIGG